MPQSLKSRKSRRSLGFTLIELLVVISIIALLIGLLLPALSRARSAARVAACLGNLKNVSAGLANYSSEFEGVLPTGVPPQFKNTPAGLRTGTKPNFRFAPGNANENVRPLPAWPNLGIDYNWMQRYWFVQLAPYVVQEDQTYSVYADAYFCPDDNFYTEEAYALRTHEDNVLNRISYIMSDTAFWDPSMFRNSSTMSEILEEDQLRESNGGPAGIDTPGRRYLSMSSVKFPDKKVWVYEVNAFHVNPSYGYNVRGMKSTMLFFDGHAENLSASSTEKYADDLFIPLRAKMMLTEDPPDADDPLYWYFSTTLNGIHGRDFIE